MVNNFYIGTSGWSYPRGEGTWNGYFYPPGKINELEYYAQFFKTVEINSSFYRPPDAGFVRQWIRRVPPDFLFTVKLWQKFTHPSMFEEATGEAAVISRDDVELFQKGIEPLVQSGKLGALLAQFPPSFKNDNSGKQILNAVIKSFNAYPVAVELRHRSWSDDTRTADLLRRNNVTWVNIDEPKFPSSVSSELTMTGDIAYFRFHGRNAETWWSGNNETRYMYLYSPEEIIELSAKIKKAAQNSRRVFAFFNNHWKAWAPRNAVDMMKSLDIMVSEPPSFTGTLFAQE